MMTLQYGPVPVPVLAVVALAVAAAVVGGAVTIVSRVRLGTPVAGGVIGACLLVAAATLTWFIALTSVGLDRDVLIEQAQTVYGVGVVPTDRALNVGSPMIVGGSMVCVIDRADRGRLGSGSDFFISCSGTDLKEMLAGR